MEGMQCWVQEHNVIQQQVTSCQNIKLITVSVLSSAAIWKFFLLCLGSLGLFTCPGAAEMTFQFHTIALMKINYLSYFPFLCYSLNFSLCLLLYIQKMLKQHVELGRPH